MTSFRRGVVFCIAVTALTARAAFGQGTPISQGNWTLHAVDSQETEGADNAATNAFDGNPNSFWATRWFSASPPHPHEIQINLGAVYAVNGFRYLPRQDGQPYGRIGQYQFYVSMDGTTWGTAVASGTFPNTAAEQQVLFTAKTGRYIRLRALSEVNGWPWTTVAELNVLASGNQPPNGTIASPTGDVTIAPGQSVTFSGSGSDPDNNLPLTYAWNFGVGGPPSSTSQNPGAVVFPTAGVFTVTFTVRDSQGTPDPTPPIRTVTVQPTGGFSPISQGNWTLHAVDSQETEGADNAATNAFDGNPNSFWATRWFSASPPHPHEIQINLGAVYAVNGFRYLPRQDGQPYGRIGQYEFYVSTDGATWGTAVASGTFPNTAAEQQVVFTAKSGRYVRLRALTEVNGQPWTVVAELNVLASGNQPPNGTITSPTSDVTIAPGQSVTFSGSGSDPDNNLPLTYLWNFGVGGPPSSTSQNPGAVVFPTAGVFTVTFTVRDSQGTPDPTPPIRTVTVQPTGGFSPISQGNWTLHAVDSQETEGADNAATNAFDGNPNSFWATRWFSASPPHPHEIQINLGAVYTVNGFRYLPRQDGQPYGRIGQYQFYVSMDGTTWGTAVASGTFPNTAAEQQVLFTAKTGRYIRLRALSEVNGWPWTTVAELNVLASGNQPPNGTIASPTGDVTIAPGQSVTFNGSGSDPDNNLPLTYAWNFGAGGPPPSTSQNPGAVVFPTAGVFTVTFTVRDSQGTPDPTPATRTVTVQSGSTAATLIPQTGWSVRFVDSEEFNAGNYRAANAFDGNPNTTWTTQWFNGGPLPPHEIQIDLGSSSSIVGFRYLPYQPWQAGRVGEYEFYISGDGVNWGAPVAAGAFPDVNTSTARDVMFVPKTGRYVRLRALTEVNNVYVFTAMAELNVWRAGTGTNQAPLATISSPAQNVTIGAGTAVDLAGVASDPDLNLPLTYRWSVSAGSGISDSTVLNAGIVHFDRAGTFQVTFTVTDSLGKSAAATRTVTVLSQPLATTGWTLRFVDSQETAGGDHATNAFDGDPGTMWASQWLAAQPPPPHEIQIDLGTTRQVAGFRYLPRQDGMSVGNIGQYEFFVSSDGVNWAAAAAGTFTAAAGEKEVTFAPRSARYVRLRALTEVNGLPYTAVAELAVLQPQCVVPSVQLFQPRSGYLQRSSTLQLVANACLSQSGQGVRFVVDGAPVDDFAAPYEVMASALSAAEHVVEAYLVNSGGNQVSGVTTYDLAMPVGIGDLYVAMGDGITVGHGDDISTDDNSADGRNLLGGYTPILADGLTAARGYPVAVVNKGVQSTTSASGASSINTLLQLYPNANYFLLMYGHNDASAQRPSGLGLTPQNPGYAGSFKDFMQRIITAVRAAGKVALLAKHPAVIPLNGPDDTAVQQYNMVIDELVAANAIPVVPPDFHTYFKTRTATHYSNSTEPNGLGYQSMAQLWLQAILGAP